MNASNIDGKVSRLEFTEGQLHTTYHNRNDGMAVFERWLDNDADGPDVALCDEVGAEIARKVNAHDALAAALRAYVEADREHGGTSSAAETHNARLAAGRAALADVVPVEVTEPGNVAAYFAARLGRPVEDSTLADLPCASACGADCVAAIDAAADLRDHAIAACGEGEEADQVADTCETICCIYWRG